MITLNLTAKGTEQELIKKYLEENASETLAEKINNGVKVEKDGKTLINKKTLDGFMKYATDEARKQAEKGASAVCVQSDVVFGWAIHYFEEESIVGKLYNEDGSEYKINVVAHRAPNVTQKVTKSEPQSDQLSLFDFSDEPIIETTIEDTSLCINTDTGEIIEEKPSTETDDLVAIICEIFGCDLEVRL
ncbi:MAG: PcfK-like family protein [Clostridia bacterium]|nr:PcfK-like family protein [Clostridia bacterium]